MNRVGGRRVRYVESTENYTENGEWRNEVGRYICTYVMDGTQAVDMERKMKPRTF